jgi:hypothetical protein
LAEYSCKAVIYRDLEDVYGPCGCGMTLATLPVLLPRNWLIEEKPTDVEEHDFGLGPDFRRISGFSCNQVLEYEMDGIEFLANFSCCPECAERAVSCGYAIWSEKKYPMILR